MSRETEKIFRQLDQYMNEHRDELSDDASEEAVAQRFMDEYNASVPLKNSVSLPRTADDYLELAEDATTKKKKLEYLSKALELDPDNLDAAHMTAELTAKKPEDLLTALSALIEKGISQMEASGYFQDAVGDFWGLLETRPYMRLRYAYFDLLTKCGMMRKAVSEGDELLRLCENDNLGVRYGLMHLYAFLENEDDALALHKQSDEYDETQILLPLAILYYKKADFERSLQYLQRLSKVNKDIKRFLRTLATDREDELADEYPLYGYRPFTMEELICEYYMNAYLFDSVGAFYDWACRNLKKPAKQKEG